LVAAVEVAGLHPEFAHQGRGGVASLADFAVHDERSRPQRVEAITQRIDRNVDRSRDGTLGVPSRGTNIEQGVPLGDQFVQVIGNASGLHPMRV
jgi:hypothetical protein